ncbi:FAD/NAD(P)-binding domain-containing protein, partial [Guyanagaster necrorhizus]
ICIIGAGPTGLATLKTVLDTEQFKSGNYKPTVFEARDQVGGVWQPSEPVDDQPPLSALYDSLTTNIPHPVMSFTSLPFPPSTPLYPVARVVEDYLQAYAKHFGLNTHIRLGTSVVALQFDSESSKWKVKLSTKETLDFDWVIVCSGHYSKPRYPDTPGLSKWLHDKRASHSSWYRRPQDVIGDKILVVGNGPSGIDISAELRRHVKILVRSVSGGTGEEDGNLIVRPRAVHYEDDGSVLFEDGSKEAGIDRCILATGFEVSFPFLSNEDLVPGLPAAVPPLPRELYNSTYNIFPLAQHLFPFQSRFPPTTIAFMGLLIKVAPFPLVEAQARAALHIFAHPNELDLAKETADIVTRYQQLRAELQTEDPLALAKAWHVFKGSEQFDYRDELYAYTAPSFGGDAKVVPQWEKDMYDNKITLKQVWFDLVKEGVADDWVRGVGENGPQDWVALAKRMMKRARQERGEALIP